MKFYTPSCPVPAAAITYAGLLSPYQPILFTTQFGYYDSASSIYDEDQLSKYKGRPLVWVISYVSVTLVRDWGTSIANIVLTSSIPSVDCQVPPMPDLGKIRGGNHPYLTIEDEIRIYGGYVPTSSTPITADMLDQHSIDMCPQYKQSSIGDNTPGCKAVYGSDFKQDSNKPLCPIFWGFIDNIQIDADERGGIKCIIQCRDRGRIFSDTKMIAIPSLQGRLTDIDNDNLSQYQQSRLKQGMASGNREDILMEVAKAATGQLFTGIEQGTNKCWKPVIGGSDKRINSYKPKWGDKQPKYPSQLSAQLFTSYSTTGKYMKRLAPPEDPASWVREATHKIMLPHSEPRFHIWAQRPPLIKASGASVFQVLKKSPLEVIQYLANTEERPTDFFTSHINGDFVFAPRVLDTSGFYDPYRHYRTYFFRTWPNEINKTPPRPNQMIKAMRTLTSSLATFNRFVVIDSNSEGANSAFLEKLRASIEVLPWTLDGNPDSDFAKENPNFPSGRAIYPPCRNQIIYDGYLSSYGEKDYNRAGGALIVAISQARTWSREMHGVQLNLIGDPTLYPGEAIRVYNSILHDFGTSINPGTQLSSEILEEQQNKLESLSSEEGKETVQSLLRESRDLEDGAISNSFDTSANKIAKDTNRSHQTVTNKESQQIILPVYKVRSIQHNIKTTGRDAGFTTKVECIADY